MPTAAEILNGLDSGGAAMPPPQGGGAASRILGEYGPSEEETRANIRQARLKRIALESMKKIQGEGGATDIGIHNYTLGLTRPVGALGASLGGELGEYLGGEPQTFGERWRAHEGAYDEYLKQAKENSGWGGTAAGALGSLATLPSQGAMSLPKMIATGGISSGVQSAAESTGSASDRLKQTATGAAVGAGTSAVLGALFNRFLGSGGRAAERELNRGVPPDELKKQAQNLYSQLDQAGVAYAPQQAGDLMQGLQSELSQAGFNPKIQPKAAAVVDEFANKVSGDQPLTLGALQDLRQLARSAAKSIEPEDRRIAHILMDQIDGFIGGQDPALSIGGMDKGQIAQTWKDARSKWRAYNVTEDLLWNVSKAERRAASANSGANTENTLRQNIRSTLDRATQPGRRNPYTDAEIAAMEGVVSGTPVQNALRSYGNRFGGSGPLGMSGALTGGTALGGALIGAGVPPQAAAGIGTAAVPVLWGTGKLARMGSSRMAENQIDDLIRLVSTEGMQSPRIQAIMQGPPTRERLALTQFLGSMATGGGREAAKDVPSLLGMP